MKPQFATDVFTPIEFKVFGVPGSQGSKTRYGKVMVEGSSKVGREKLKNWRSAVSEAAALHVPATGPLDGPLGIGLAFRFARPASWPKSAPCLHMVKPDKDKVQRATFDALTQSGLIVDDARLCSIRLDAIVTDEWLGASIEIWRVV